MTKFLCGLLSMFLSGLSSGVEPGFKGEWKSDRELAMSFIRNRVLAEGKAYQLTESMVGRLTISISEDTIRYYLLSLRRPSYYVGIHRRGRQSCSRITRL